MKIIYDITIFPLLYIPMILLILAIFSLHLYIKTQMKTDLYLSISFSSILLLSLIIFTANGAGRVLFWSKPFHLAALTVFLTILAVQWLAEKRSTSDRLPLIFLVVILALALITPALLGGFIIAFAFLLYAGYLFYRYKVGKALESVQMALFVAVAVEIVMGTILDSQAFQFLFSATVVALLMYEAVHYFDRVVSLLRNAGLNSITDTLTNLYNKGFLMRKTEQLIQKCEIGIIFIDIDNFKQLNDTSGHEYGDKILIKVGETLKYLLEGKGFACRFGGEELCAIVTNGKAGEIAEKFRKVVKEEAGVTVSVGVAVSSEIEDGTERAQRLIKKADHRMYAAKQNGKDCVYTSDEFRPILKSE